MEWGKGAPGRLSAVKPDVYQKVGILDGAGRVRKEEEPLSPWTQSCGQPCNSSKLLSTTIQVEFNLPKLKSAVCS